MQLCCMRLCQRQHYRQCHVMVHVRAKSESQSQSQTETMRCARGWTRACVHTVMSQGGKTAAEHTHKPIVHHHPAGGGNTLEFICIRGPANRAGARWRRGDEKREVSGSEVPS